MVPLQGNAFIYYSSFTEAQLVTGHMYVVETIVARDFHEQYVFKKYANKKFLKASVFAREWAHMHWPNIAEVMEGMTIEQ